MSASHEFWPWYNSHVQECNFMLCVLLNCKLLALTSRYLISSMPKIASIASFMFSWIAARAQGKTLVQGGFKFCWKQKNLIRPFNTIYTVGPSACDAQETPNSSAHLTPSMPGTQHLSLLEMWISSPLLPVILVLQGVLSDLLPEHLAGLLELLDHWRYLLTAAPCPTHLHGHCPTHRITLLLPVLSWKESEEWICRLSFTWLILRLVCD